MTTTPRLSAHSKAGVRNYFCNMMARFVSDYERRRAQDKLNSAEEVNGPPVLTVELADMYARDNASTHHTGHFHIAVDPPGVPVLRRGLPFFLAIRFSRPLDIADDYVRLIFEFGPEPNPTGGTRHLIPVTSRQELAADRSKWDIRIHRQHCHTTTFQVQIPTDCPVGVWRCKIQTSKVVGPRTQVKEFLVNEDIYILFNPWCKDDGVFMESEAERQEYVENDSGKVWKGSWHHPRGRHWIFGQYDDVVLPVTMLLLDRSSLDPSRRGSPVHVARAICSVVTAEDRDGLLRWDMERTLRDGTPPSAWTGSVAILEKYLKNGGEPVGFGQCWVFSGIVVTVCRALGIPCRSVTNYVSAHSSLTPERYLSTEGKFLDSGNQDSVWSFHVWNEVWMARPDLPRRHGGWQVVDATPRWDGGVVSTCGPASVEAVRRGEVGLIHDTSVVYIAVHGEFCHYKEDHKSESGFIKIRPNQYRIGRKIVTKAVGRVDDEGDGDLEEITNNYKQQDGSAEEHAAVINAIKGFPPAQKKTYRVKMGTELLFELVEIEHVMFGQPFSINVLVHNRGMRRHDVNVALRGYSVLHTGAKVHTIKKVEGIFSVHPYQKECLMLSITSEEYVDKLVDHSLIKIFAFAIVRDTGQIWSEEEDFQMIKPKLAIETKGHPKAGQKCSVIFSFQNPLNVALTHCVFSMEVPGVLRPKLLQYRDVMPNELVTITECFTPKMAGKRKINASFTSRQLTEVVGSSALDVWE